MLGVWGGDAGGRQRRRAGFCNPHAVCCGWDFFFQSYAQELNPQKGGEQLPIPPLSHPLLFPLRRPASWACTEPLWITMEWLWKPQRSAVRPTLSLQKSLR